MSIIPLVSIVTAFYAVLTIIFTIVLAPLNYCISTRPTLGEQLRRLFVPAINLQYKCAWSSSRASSDNVCRSWPGSIHSNISDHRLGMPIHTADAPSNVPTLFVLLLSPGLSISMACAAFVVALWWIMSAITANEVADGVSGDHPKKEGQGGFDEGQRLARKLRIWWIGWLSGEKFR